MVGNAYRTQEDGNPRNSLFWARNDHLNYMHEEIKDGSMRSIVLAPSIKTTYGCVKPYYCPGLISCGILTSS